MPPHANTGVFSSWRAMKAALVILGWTAVYYSTSAASGIWNKQLVDEGAVSPTVLTLLHLLVSLASDMAIMRYSKEGPARFPPDHGRHTTWDIVWSFTPISVFVIMAKLSTYFSYQYVSIALSHTAKASEPIFNVLVAAVFFGEYRAAPVYVSLVPIALGVWMASVTDFTYNHTGFFWATTSALMKVLQNIYTKRLMSAGNFTFWEIHMYCGAASLIILAPVLMVQTATSKENPFAHFPAFSLLMCSVLQWASSVSSYMVLHLVSHLTFTIINVTKRLVIILSGMVFVGQAFTAMNTAGVMLSALGILAYNIVKDATGGGGGMPPLPANKLSLPAWSAWLATLLYRYNHLEDAAHVSPPSGAAGAGAASGSGGGGSGGLGGAMGASSGALFSGIAGDGSGDGLANGRSGRGSGLALDLEASEGTSAGAGAVGGGSTGAGDDVSRWRRVVGGGGRATGGFLGGLGLALGSGASTPPGKDKQGSGARAGAGYLAGFISPLNTPFGARFFDRGVVGGGGGGGGGGAGGDGAGGGAAGNGPLLPGASPSGSDNEGGAAGRVGRHGQGDAAGVSRRLQLGGGGGGGGGGSGIEGGLSIGIDRDGLRGRAAANSEAGTYSHGEALGGAGGNAAAAGGAGVSSGAGSTPGGGPLHRTPNGALSPRLTGGAGVPHDVPPLGGGSSTRHAAALGRQPSAAEEAAGSSSWGGAGAVGGGTWHVRGGLEDVGEDGDADGARRYERHARAAGGSAARASHTSSAVSGSSSSGAPSLDDGGAAYFPAALRMTGGDTVDGGRGGKASDDAAGVSSVVVARESWPPTRRRSGLGGSA